MKAPEQYFSKLLLFGEYGLIYNSMALSVPFSRFSGYLDFDHEMKHPESTAEIRKLSQYLKTNHASQNLVLNIDLDKLEYDIQNCLYFNSSIPQQYGVGSSGALVAALYKRYFAGSKPNREFSPEKLKSDFSKIESYFHGKSSGLDPLISYLNKPILINSNKEVVPINFDISECGLAIALIDTKSTGATGPLVKHFLEQMENTSFQQAFHSQFIQANDACIQNLLSGKIDDFLLNLEKLILFQLKYFEPMIP